VHPLTGRDGEMLAMDVARDGPKSARSLLVISSACHGVEGFCGSGVQVALLEDADWHRAAHGRRRRRPLRPRPQSLGLLLVAADDARERRPQPQLPRLLRRSASQPAYDELATLIVPGSWPPDAATVDATARFVAEHGAKAWQAAISGGQYHHPHGLFYGGDAPTWSQQTLRQVLREHGTRCSRLGWIDLHTGLGPSGHGERIYAGKDDAVAYARAKDWWGEVTSIYDGSSTSALLTGMMFLAAYEECDQAEYTGMALEYGTLPNMEVMDALRADQWLELHPEADDATRRAIKRQVRDAFYTDTDEWKKQIVAQGGRRGIWRGARPERLYLGRADHPVGAHQHRLGHLDAECRGRFQVDDRLDRRRLLDRQIGRRSAAQHAIGVVGQAAVGVDQTRAVGAQRPCLGEDRPARHHRDPPIHRVGDDAVAVLHREAVGEERDRLHPVARHPLEGRGQLVAGARRDVTDIQAHAARGRLGVRALARFARVGRIGEQGDAADAGHHLEQELEALAVELGAEVGEAGHAGVRPRQALRQAGLRPGRRCRRRRSAPAVRRP
jgi:hypothetical protein